MFNTAYKIDVLAPNKPNKTYTSVLKFSGTIQKVFSYKSTLTTLDSVGTFGT